jgi:hypothetical protein
MLLDSTRRSWPSLHSLLAVLADDGGKARSHAPDYFTRKAIRTRRRLLSGGATQAAGRGRRSRRPRTHASWSDGTTGRSVPNPVVGTCGSAVTVRVVRADDQPAASEAGVEHGHNPERGWGAVGRPEAHSVPYVFVPGRVNGDGPAPV